MSKLNISLSELHLPLKVNWKLSRNETIEKINFIIRLDYKNSQYFGEVAFNIRYGETLENTIEQFNLFQKRVLNLSIEEGVELLRNYEMNNSLKCGIEQCLVKAICAEKKIEIHEFFELPKPKPVSTFFTIPIMPIKDVANYYKANQLNRYSGIKLKINREKAFDLIDEACKHLTRSQQLLVDANEAFTCSKELTELMNEVEGMPILCFEQPFPKKMHEENLKVSEQNLFPLMADESIEDIAHFDHLKTGFDFINVKSMKTGGLIRAVEIIKEAKEHDFKIMMGCMIETSLSMSYTWEISSLVDLYDFDGPLLLKKDPYGFMLPKYLDLELI